MWFLCLLELSAAVIDPDIRDFPHLWIFSVHFAKSLPIPPSHVNVEVDTASKQGSRACGLGLCCTLSAVAAVLDADACVIDSLHLTSAMSEQRSIQQISARKTTRSSVCACLKFFGSGAYVREYVCFHRYKTVCHKAHECSAQVRPSRSFYRTEQRRRRKGREGENRDE